MDLLKRQKLAVTVEGQLVVLQIGNATMKMEYETAIQLSTWLRVRGKEAKRIAGDTARHWTVIGRLSDALRGDPIS